MRWLYRLAPVFCVVALMPSPALSQNGSKTLGFDLLDKGDRKEALVATIRGCKRLRESAGSKQKFSCRFAWRDVRAEIASDEPNSWSALFVGSQGTEWLADCRHDDIEDKDVCSLKTGGLTIYYFGNGPVAPTWRGAGQPGTSQVYRIDNRPPVYMSDEPTDLEYDVLFFGMISGKNMRARTIGGAAGRIDMTFDLTDFSTVALLFDAFHVGFLTDRE